MKEVIKMPGFWRMVAIMGVSFVSLFFLVKWILDGFSFDFFQRQDPVLLVLGSIVAGFIYGFFVAYGRFKKQLHNKK